MKREIKRYPNPNSPLLARYYSQHPGHRPAPPRPMARPMPIARRPRTDSRTPAEILGTERNIANTEALLRAIDRRKC